MIDIGRPFTCKFMATWINSKWPFSYRSVRIKKFFQYHPRLSMLIYDEAFFFNLNS